MLTGVAVMCLALLLTSCALLPSLPPTRVVIACPDGLTYKPNRTFPEVPDPLTNLGLENYVYALVSQLKAEWAESDLAAERCRDWLKRQGLK